MKSAFFTVFTLALAKAAVGEAVGPQHAPRPRRQALLAVLRPSPLTAKNVSASRKDVLAKL